MFATHTEAQESGLSHEELLNQGKFAVLFVCPCLPPIFCFSEDTMNEEVERLARTTEQKVFILRPTEVREVELVPLKSTMLGN